MTLSFPRVQAGEYQVTVGNKMVGYIKKQTASKWIMYRATNPSVLGKPIAVEKTLRDLKAQSETLFADDIKNMPVVAKPSSTKSFVKPIQDPEKLALMKELLENEDSKKIKLTEYSVNLDGELEEIDLFGEVLEGDEIFA